METLITITLIEGFLINVVSVIEIQRRRTLLQKWITGQMTMEELRALKRQPWFAKQFPEKTIPKEKKND